MTKGRDTVELRTDGPGVELFVNGQKIMGATRFEASIGVGDVTCVKIEMVAADVHLELPLSLELAGDLEGDPMLTTRMP